MFSSRHTELFVAAWVATSLLLFASLSRSAHAQGDKPSSQTANMIVVVTEADTGQPISQAHITLQFPAKFGSDKKITYNAKTDAQGRCKLVDINKGTIILAVTAESHQSYGKQLQLEKDGQVFEVKLKRPQPLL